MSPEDKRARNPGAGVDYARVNAGNERKQNKSPKQVAPQPVRSAPTTAGAAMESGVLLAMMEPRQAAAGSILSLQRLSGNRTVTRHLQAKLTVGPSPTG